MAIKKETIHELVEVFYQPPFKTFYVNSLDGETFLKPLGVFVSLGITTSPRVLQDIRDVLKKSASGLDAKLVEIKSTKVAGQFLNMVLPGTEEIEQYRMTEIPSQCIDDREEAVQELESLRATSEQTETLDFGLVQKISKLEELIDRLDKNSDGWEDHMIQRVDDTYKVFHKKVNYRMEPDGTEYRIGIYVTEVI